MLGRFFLFLLVAGHLYAGTNFADTLLDACAKRLSQTLQTGSPPDQVILAEDIYFLSHESAQQERIGQLLERILAETNHQEVKVETGYFLTQHYRQIGRYDLVEQLIKKLGYVDQWQVLGPISPNRNLDIRAMAKTKAIYGLDRQIEPFSVRLYGSNDYWSEGLGHYGFFNANQAIYPNQLAGALFTTRFYAPQKGVYRLGLGWSHYASAWINRTRVFQGEEKQEPHPDQEVITFEVKKGWHLLSLYTESRAEEPNLGFYARLTDQNGAPVEFQEAGRRTPRGKVKVLSGEPGLFELAKQQDAYTLASLALIKEQAFHSELGSPKDLLSKAFEANPDRAVITKLLSLVDDANEKLQYLRAFLKGLPDDRTHGLDRAWAHTELGQLALVQRRYWEARHHADLAIEADASYWPAMVLRNNTFSSLGLDGEALAKTLQLLEQHPGVPWLLMDLSDQYRAMDFMKEAETYVDQVLALRRSNAKYAEIKIGMLKRRGDTAALEAFYQSLVRDSPFAPLLTINYAEFLDANNKEEKAEQLLAGALRQMPDNPSLLQSMGELLLGMSRPDAYDYLERSLALRPQNPDLEKLLALSREEGIQFYAPYRIAQAPDVPVTEVTPIVVNYNNTVTKVAANGQSSVYHQLEYQILDDQGASEMPFYDFSYSPLRQKAEVIKAEVVSGDQTIPLTRFRRYRISDEAYRMYYDVIGVRIEFPTLKKGDIVRIEYRIDDVDDTNIFGDYFGDLHYFAGNYPVKRMSYTLIMPQNRKIHYHVEKMEPEFTQRLDGNNKVYTWTRDDISSYEAESNMPGLDTYLPYVGVSTFDDWQHMARWYKELIEDQLNLDNDTKKIVAELVEGADSNLEKVKRIHEYVITNTRYVALEFGIHGYKPYEVNQVCSRQFGDCKDKASLIVAMCREAGIEANIVITRTSDRGEVNPYPAMLSYFNHAIAHIPEFDLFLDGTAEFSGINELPKMDQGAMVLIVDKDGNGKLTTIPVYDNNRQNYDLVVAMQPDGGAEIQGKMSYEGALTPSLRQFLSIEAKLAENIQNIVGDMLPGLAVTEANREGKGLNDPITLEFKGNSTRLLQTGEGRLELPLTILSSQLTQAYAPNARRKFPLELGGPRVKTIDVLLDAPEGYTLADAPKPLELEDDNFKVAIHTVETSPNRYKVSYRLTFKKTWVEPSDYDNLRSMLQAHDRVLDQSINFVVR